jgi:hypothetical protein
MDTQLHLTRLATPLRTVRHFKREFILIVLFNNSILTVGSDMKPTTDRLNYNTPRSAVELTDSSDIQRTGSQYGLLRSADVRGFEK